MAQAPRFSPATCRAFQPTFTPVHEGYIPWAEYEENQRRLRDAAQARGEDRRKSPPREGPALLQGLVLCGVCGARMVVHYHTRRDGRTVSSYVCEREATRSGAPRCQTIQGETIDHAVGELLVQTGTTLAIEGTIQVLKVLSARGEDDHRFRARSVERDRYEADLARHRYLRVDPDNRLVAVARVADWNGKLRDFRQAGEDHGRLRQLGRLLVAPEVRARILALVGSINSCHLLSINSCHLLV